MRWLTRMNKLIVFDNFLFATEKSRAISQKCYFSLLEMEFFAQPLFHGEDKIKQAYKPLEFHQ